MVDYLWMRIFKFVTFLIIWFSGEPDLGPTFFLRLVDVLGQL